MARPTGVYLIHGDFWGTEPPIGPFASEDAAYEYDNSLDREDPGLAVDFGNATSPHEHARQRTLEGQLLARKAPYPVTSK